MNKLFFKKLYLVLFIILFCFNSAKAQGDSAIIANADTTNFSSNKEDGWELYNSYVSEFKEDSIILEIIIKHLNNINWDDEQTIGKITKSEFWPSIPQSVSFSLIKDYFLIRVDETGKCYLKFLSGAKPSTNPAVIPIRITFKK